MVQIRILCHAIVYWFIASWFLDALWNYRFGRNLHQDFDRRSEVVGKQGGWKNIREIRPRCKGSYKSEAGNTEVKESPHFHPNSNPTKTGLACRWFCTLYSASLLWCMWCFANLLVAWLPQTQTLPVKSSDAEFGHNRGWILASDFPWQLIESPRNYL